MNYFSALQLILSNDWMNQESILNKTTGYNAIIRLFRHIFPRGLDKGDLTEQFFIQTLSPLAEISGSITSEIYGTSGLYSSNKLYKDMLKTLHLFEEY